MEAIILAGGRGERLMPLTNDRPKCMVVVDGEPIVAHQLRWLATQGITNVVISCGYEWRKIEQTVGGGSSFGLRVSYAPEDVPLGRGGGLRNAFSQVGAAEHVLALNGDLLTNLDLEPMLQAHRRAGAIATLLLVPYTSQHGIVELDEAYRITAFREKPVLPFWLSGGVYVLDPAIRELLPQTGDHETLTWPRLAAEGRLQGYCFDGFWHSIDSPKDVHEAEQALRA